MSTNYYFHPTSGPLMAFSSPLHIGKSAGGWEFIFQAYDIEGGVRHLAVSSSCNLLVKAQVPAVKLRTRQAWRELLRSGCGRIENEYGTAYSVEEFEDMVELLSPGKTWKPSGEPLQNHYDYMKVGGYSVSENTDWKDPEGFSFSLTNFS
jgi:hypothetical protein